MGLAVLLLAGCAGQQEQTEDPLEGLTQDETEEIEEDDGDFAFPSFDTVDLQGEPVSEAYFKQTELTLVVIWGTGDAGCKAELSALEELSRQYADKGFQVLGLAADAAQEEKRSLAQQISKDSGVSYPQMVPSKDSVMQELLGSSTILPTSFLVTQEGYLMGEFYQGAKGREFWAQLIETCLSELSSG